MKRNRLTIISVSAFFAAMSLWGIFSNTPDYSESERRVLASFPKVEIENILSGKFSKEFDEYTVERFPARDMWRSIKAYVKTGVFLQKDNNKIYTNGDYISKMEYPMNENMLDYASNVFDKVKDKYLNDNDIYLVVVPDKNEFLADDGGHLKVEYEKFADYMAEKMDYAQYIEIADLLNKEDYYYTDTHWRQENIVDVADRIAEAMGTDTAENYEVIEFDGDFYGVYAGQSALNCDPDTIKYLLSEGIENAEIEGAKDVYDMDKAVSRDPYEMFLSGNQPIVNIKNSLNTSGKKLVMFRDSFGCSIAPLFIDGYSEITLVDLRYISSDMIGEYV
ncbi:MAG: hypothetical protein IKU80_05730, partial [Firmicutes bacterium]|nr:hypothetical protein [Bacillota bacterium]